MTPPGERAATGPAAVACGGVGRCGVRRRRRPTEAPARRYGTRRTPWQLQADSPAVALKIKKYNFNGRIDYLCVLKIF